MGYMRTKRERNKETKKERKTSDEDEYGVKCAGKKEFDAHAHWILTSPYFSLMLSYLMESACLRTIYQKIPFILGKNYKVEMAFLDLDKQKMKKKNSALVA